jgi:hypothetical protein
VAELDASRLEDYGPSSHSTLDGLLHSLKLRWGELDVSNHAARAATLN